MKQLIGGLLVMVNSLAILMIILLMGVSIL